MEPGWNWRALTGGIYSRVGRKLELTPTNQLPKGACWGVLGSTCFYMGSNVHDVLWSFVSQSLVPSLVQEGVQEWWEWIDVATIR